MQRINYWNTPMINQSEAEYLRMCKSDICLETKGKTATHFKWLISFLLIIALGIYVQYLIKLIS